LWLTERGIATGFNFGAAQKIRRRFGGIFFPQLKQEWQQHATTARHAIRQQLIDIQLGKLRGQFGFQIGRKAFRIAAHARQQVFQIGLAAIALRFGEQNGFKDQRRLRFGQMIEKLGMDFTRPGPAAEVVQTALVDGDHRNALGSRPAGQPHAQVIAAVFQALQQRCAQPEQGKKDDDRQSRQPVALPPLPFSHTPAHFFHPHSLLCKCAGVAFLPCLT